MKRYVQEDGRLYHNDGKLCIDIVKNLVLSSWQAYMHI